MRALEPEVVDAVWAAVEPLLPEPPLDEHPLGCHRSRIPDRLCFEGILIRLVTGCAWVDVERLLGGGVGHPLRARRDAWIDAGVFDHLAKRRWSPTTASSVWTSATARSTAASTRRRGEARAPVPTPLTGANAAGASPTARHPARLGDRRGQPPRHDLVRTHPRPGGPARAARGPETLHLDRGYDSASVRQLCSDIGIDDLVGARKRKRGEPAPPKKLTLGMRWPVERTNSWLSNFRQLRHNTDRRTVHRLAKLALAVALLITAKLIDGRNRWSA
jgi:transposase